MNLSPEWVDTLRQAGFESIHWSAVGNIRAPDAEILAWADRNEHVLMTHDLDFGAILAARGSARPSVLQLRARDITPQGFGREVCRALDTYRSHLERGALISLDEASGRARILPLRDL
jgi:predicted nuclease of predicted toxin-antitoxin system